MMALKSFKSEFWLYTLCCLSNKIIERTPTNYSVRWRFPNDCEAGGTSMTVYNEIIMNIWEVHAYFVLLIATPNKQLFFSSYSSISRSWILIWSFPNTFCFIKEIWTFEEHLNITDRTKKAFSEPTSEHTCSLFPLGLCLCMMYIMYISVLNIIFVNHSLMASVSVSTSTWWQS